MNLYLTISLALAFIGGMFSLVRQFQILQQNSYFPSRYYGWLKDNLPFAGVIFLVIWSVFFNLKNEILPTAITALFMAYSIIDCIKVQKKSIKKLVFTARVKRLFAVAVIVNAVLDLIFFLKIPVAGGICASVSIALCFVTPLLCLLCWAVANPIEKAFASFYKNDAKKIIKNHTDLKVIGVTGSYGKTSVKFILTRILSEKFNTLCTPQSFNTPMGVVRTVREKLMPQTEIFVCEMGAKNVGDIKEICDIVNPDMGIITSVGAQHLDTFKSVANVFKTKFELSDAVKQKGGAVFVNGDSRELIARINPDDFSVYGTNPSFDCYADNISYGKDGSKFTVHRGGEQIELTSKLLGLHSIINITGATAVARNLGVDPADIKFAVSSLKPVEHRLEMKPSVMGSVMIDDAYNSNPEGSIEAVNVLASFSGMKKVIITPGLVELGEKEYDCNYALGLAAAKICDIMIFVGQNRSKPMTDAVAATDFNKDNVFVAKSFFEAMNIYSKFADSNTVLLVENDLPDNYLN